MEVDRAHFAQMRAFTIQAFGMKLIVDKPDLAAFATAEGSIYEIYGPNAPDAAWRHGQGGMVIGFLTDNVQETLKTIQAADGVLIGDLNVAPHFGVDGGDYGYQLYRAADNRVYAIAQNKTFIGRAVL